MNKSRFEESFARRKERLRRKRERDEYRQRREEIKQQAALADEIAQRDQASVDGQDVEITGLGLAQYGAEQAEGMMQMLQPDQTAGTLSLQSEPAQEPAPTTMQDAFGMGAQQETQDETQALTLAQPGGATLSLDAGQDVEQAGQLSGLAEGQLGSAAQQEWLNRPEVKAKIDKQQALIGLAMLSVVENDEERQEIVKMIQRDKAVAAWAEIRNFEEFEEAQIALGRELTAALYGSYNVPHAWWESRGEKMPAFQTKDQAYKAVWAAYAGQMRKAAQDAKAKAQADQDARMKAAADLRDRFFTWMLGNRKASDTFSQKDLWELKRAGIDADMMQRLKHAVGFFADGAGEASLYDADAMKSVFNVLVEDPAAEELSERDKLAIQTFRDWYEERVYQREKQWNEKHHGLRAAFGELVTAGTEHFGRGLQGAGRWVSDTFADEAISAEEFDKQKARLEGEIAKWQAEEARLKDAYEAGDSQALSGWMAAGRRAREYEGYLETLWRRKPGVADTGAYLAFQSGMVTSREDAENRVWEERKATNKALGNGGWWSQFDLVTAAHELGRMTGDTGLFFVPYVGGMASLASLTQRARDEAAGRQGTSWDRAKEIATYYGPIAWAVEKIAFGGIGKGATGAFGMNKWLMDQAIKRAPGVLARYYTRSTAARTAAMAGMGFWEEVYLEPLLEAILKNAVANPALFGKNGNNYFQDVLAGWDETLTGQGLEGWPEFRREVSRYFEDPNMLVSMVVFSAALSMTGVAGTSENVESRRGLVNGLKAGGFTERQVAEFVENPQNLTQAQQQEWLNETMIDNLKKDPEGTIARMKQAGIEIKRTYDIERLAQMQSWNAAERLGLVPFMRRGSQPGTVAFRWQEKGKEEEWTEMSYEAANALVNNVLQLDMTEAEQFMLSTEDYASEQAVEDVLKERGWVIEDTDGAVDVAKAQALADLANARIRAYVEAGMTQAEAEQVQEPDVLGTSMPLGVATRYASSMSERVDLARARGEIGANESARSYAHVVRFRRGGQVQRILRRARGEVSLANVIEEIQEQHVYDYCESNNLTVDQLGGQLQELQRLVNEVYGTDKAYSFIRTDQPATERDVIEGFSKLGRARFLADLMNRPGIPDWIKNLIGYVLYCVRNMQAELALGNAVRKLEQEGKMNQELLDVLDSMAKDLDDVFALAEARMDIDGMIERSMAQAKAQAELDALAGRGVVTSATEVQAESETRQANTEAKEAEAKQEAQEEVDKLKEEIKEATGQDVSDEEAMDRAFQAGEDAVSAEVALAGQAVVDDAFAGVFVDDVAVRQEEPNAYLGRVEIGKLTVSTEIKQFKMGANRSTGEVEENKLSGEWRTTSPPIAVWKRKNGALEIISGRHRFAHAQRNGKTAINAFVFLEDDVHDARWALAYDAETNIQDGQTRPEETALYVRHMGYTIEDCATKGLYRGDRENRNDRRRDNNLSACELAVYSGVRLWDVFVSRINTPRAEDAISWNHAWQIAYAAKNNESLQSAAIDHYFANKKNIGLTLKTIEGQATNAHGLLGIEESELVQGDLFTKTVDASVIVNSILGKFGDFHQRQQKSVASVASAIARAVKRGTLSSDLQVDVKDPATTKMAGEVRAKVAERWNHMMTNNECLIAATSAFNCLRGKTMKWVEEDVRRMLSMPTIQMELTNDGVLVAYKGKGAETEAEKARRDAENAMRIEIIVADTLASVEEFANKNQMPLELANAKYDREKELAAWANKLGRDQALWDASVAESQAAEQAASGAVSQDEGPGLFDFSIEGERQDEGRGRADGSFNYMMIGENAATHAEYKRNGYAFFDEADQKWKAVVDMRDARLKRRPSVGKGGRVSAGLGAWLECEELFRAYPDLYRYRVTFVNEAKQPWAGLAIPKEREIVVNIGRGRIGLLETLAHEIQHVIQAHEGFAHGASGLVATEKGAALQYLDESIAQLSARKDAAGQKLLADVTRLRDEVEKGITAPSSVYWRSHGETEARGAEDIDADQATLLQAARRRAMQLTVPLTGNITDLGGITFDRGRFGSMLATLLRAKGDYLYDTQVLRMRDDIKRMAARLEAYHPEQKGGTTGLQMFADVLGMITTAERHLPGNYGFGLEPYKIWANFFARVYGLGAKRGNVNDHAKAVDELISAVQQIPMSGWDNIMMRSMANQFLEWAKANYDFLYDSTLITLKSQGLRGSQLDTALFNALFTNATKGEIIGFRWAAEYGETKIRTMMAKFVKRVGDQVDFYRKDVLLGRIRREVAKASPKRKRGEKPIVGKIGAEEAKRLEIYLRLIDMTAAEYDAWRDTYFANPNDPTSTLPKWEDVPEDTVCPVKLYDYEGEETTYEVTKGEMEAFADFGSMSPEAAERCAKAIGEFITMGKNGWQTVQERRKLITASNAAPVMSLIQSMDPARVAKLRREDMLSATGGVGMDPFGFMQNLGQQFYALSKIDELSGWSQDLMQRSADASVAIELSQYELHQYVRREIKRLFGIEDQYDQAQFLAEWKRTQKTGITITERPPNFQAKAQEEYEKNLVRLLRFKVRHHGLKSTRDALEEFIKLNLTLDADITARIWAAFGDFTRDLNEREQRLAATHPSEDVFTSEELDRYGNMKKWVDQRAQKLYDASAWGKPNPATGQTRQAQSYELEVSKDTAAYIILLSEQTSYDEWRQQNGFTDDVVMKLHQFVGAEGVEFAYKLREKLNERSTVVQEIVEKRYGVPFPLEDNYFRAFFDVQRDLKQQDVAEGMQTGDAAGGGTYGFIRSRQKHSERLDLTIGVTNAFVAAMREQDVFIHCSDISRDMRDFLNYRDEAGKRMSDVLREKLGKGTVERLAEWADSLDRTGVQYIAGALEMNRIMERMSGAGAKGVLAFYMPSLMKQATAMFNSLYGVDEVDFGMWLNSCQRVMRGTAVMSASDMAKMPEIYTRSNTSYQAVQRALTDAQNAYHSKLEKVSDAGMGLMSDADAMANAFSSAVLYDAVYRNLEGQGMSQQEMHDAAMQAVRVALENKAQPMNHRQRSLVAKNKFFAFVGPLFLMGESINTIGRVYSLAKAGHYKRAGALWLTHGSILAVIQAFIDLLTDDEKKRKKRTLWGYLAMAILGPLTGIPIAGHFIASGAEYGLRQAGINIVIGRSSVVPLGDLEKYFKDISGLAKLFDSKASWQEKGIGLMKAVQAIAIIIAATTMNSTQGKATLAAAAMAAAAASNLATFGLKVERNVEDWLD